MASSRSGNWLKEGLPKPYITIKNRHIRIMAEWPRQSDTGIPATWHLQSLDASNDSALGASRHRELQCWWWKSIRRRIERTRLANQRGNKLMPCAWSPAIPKLNLVGNFQAKIGRFGRPCNSINGKALVEVFNRICCFSYIFSRC